MRQIISYSATLSLFAALMFSSCRQKQPAPAKRPELSSILPSLYRDTVTTVYQKLSPEETPRYSDSCWLLLQHHPGEFFICFRNGQYIDLEKCLPGMDMGLHHELNLLKTAADTITIVDPMRMSYISFVLDKSYDNCSINGSIVTYTYPVFDCLPLE